MLLPVAAAGALLTGMLVLLPIALFNDGLTNALYDFGLTVGKYKIPVVVMAIGGVAIVIYVVLTAGWEEQRKRAIELDPEKGRLQNFLTDRKRWIIGLSLITLFLVAGTAQNYIKYDKLFHKADVSATGEVVEVDSGEPPSGEGEDADSGSPPSSHYQFQVNGVTYDGWVKDELVKGDKIAISYNTSDPKINQYGGSERL